MDLELLTNQVCTLCRGTGQFIQQEARKISPQDIEEKGRHNFVTYVDKVAEERLIAGLSKAIPGAGFIAEEGTITKTSRDFNWIIDPLDGTTNFIHAVPIYSISIALRYHDEIILGVVYEINLKECFYSWKDSPAFLNWQKIHVSKTDGLNNSLLATGFPYDDRGKTGKYLELFRQLILNSRGIRRLGSAAVDLAYVACGRFDVFYEYGLNPWDVAAGAFIVQQAGGQVTDFSGGDNFLHGKQLISSNGLIHQEMLEILSNYFEES